MIYGNKFLNLQESDTEEVKEMSVGEFLESLITLEDTIEALEESEDALQEGANIDYIKELTSVKKEIRIKNKELKQFKKDKDKKNYIKTAEEAIKILEKSKKSINKIDPSMGSTIISIVLKVIKCVALFNASVNVGVALNGIAGLAVSGAGGALSGLSIPLPTFDNTPTEKQWNQYRKNAILYIESTIKNMKALIKDTKNW